MPTRPAIPRDIQRKLWALSMGHCFNSDCAQALFAEGTSIGEIAHILPHSESGDASLNNLLLLCPTCHTMIDKNRPGWPISILKTWHLQRQEEIRRRFTKQCDSFRELEKLVRPILQQNAAIFENYGPTEGNSSATARRSLWLKFEPKLIVNNQKLFALFKANMRLFHRENRRTIEEFALHVDEFVTTRNTDFPDRVVLFPQDINAMFGLESLSSPTLPPSISALQNFVKHLIARNQFISLELTPCQLMRYTKRGQVVEIDLSNRPRMQQLYFSHRFYRPQTTEVRLSDLVYILKWLDERGIGYCWDDISRLTEIRVADLYNVTFCYKYSLSRADIVDLSNKTDMIIVNLYGWNNSDIDEQTVTRTSESGVHSLNQREFCEFMRRRGN